RGRVRIDLPVYLAREVIIPRMPELLARYPHLELVLSTTDRRVEPVREGFDCVLRVGDPGDSDLVGRRLGAFVIENFASPAYLARYGMPRTPEDLEGHLVVHYETALGSEPPGFEYVQDGVLHDRPMR